MSRNLLHKSKLGALKEWLDKNKIEHRPGRGDWQVLQIKVKNGFQCIFDRFDVTNGQKDVRMTPEHYTVDRRLEGLIFRFLRESSGTDAVHKEKR